MQESFEQTTTTKQGGEVSPAASIPNTETASSAAPSVASEPIASPAASASNTAARPNTAPIGIFDSGFGGLTVTRKIMQLLPQESIAYFGDTARFPYGMRSLDEVDEFVQQIGSWLVDYGVKLIVIACNTATAAGLAHAQKTFDVPIVGVVDSVAQAAVRTSENQRVGVIATKATIESDAYSQAIRAIDPEITVFSIATPRFVEIAEQGIRIADDPIENYTSPASKVYIRPAFREIAQEYLEPLRRCGIDTLVLGCTHFPLLKSLIGGMIGRNVTLISSATEVAREVVDILAEQGCAAPADQVPEHRFFTTSTDLEEFKRFGSRVLQSPIEMVSPVDLLG
ncbi:MAG: glutamate racemase [Eggerthellaceae bacterium]|nr:glutamate racemase [Eggerthellaceae bacterium]